MKEQKKSSGWLNAAFNLYSQQLVKLGQGHVLVLHLPAGVLDGVNAAAQEVRGRRREARKGTTPRQSRAYQLVQEDA